MLCWRSFPEWGREHVVFSFAYKGGQYLIYEWPQPIATQITQDARPKFIDSPLTLILPWVYHTYAIISFGIVYHSWCFGSHSIIFMYFLLHHFVVL